MGEDYYKWVHEAILHIEANLGEEVNLPGVAEQAGYSVFHFGRIFQGVTGETVMDYVRKRRLTEAARALVHTDRRILDIALDWQYDSHEAFTRAFQAGLRYDATSIPSPQALRPASRTALPRRNPTRGHQRSSDGDSYHQSTGYAGSRDGLHRQE